MMVFNRNRSQVFTSKCGPSAISLSPRPYSSSRYLPRSQQERSLKKSENKLDGVSRFSRGNFFVFQKKQRHGLANSLGYEFYWKYIIIGA